jgi:3-phosphoinositide dependent protein kinase-1
MSHPGVVKLVESFQKGNYMIILLELGPFGDMFSFISTVHSHPHLHHKKHKIATYYLAQALEVIDYIHSLGILHRDIKVTQFIGSHKTSY